MNWLRHPLRVIYYVTFAIGLLLWMSVLMPLAFLVDCSATNQTNEAIWVTPIGTVGKKGTRSLLPLYRTSFPCFVLSKRGHFRVEPGETFLFTYDMDDINFSELIVEDRSQQMGQIVVNPNPTANQYVAPKTTDFVIEDVADLQPVPANVRQTVLDGRRLGRFWAMYLVFAVPLLFETMRFTCRQMPLPAAPPRG